MSDQKTISFPIDHEKLMRAMLAQDDIGALLRVHYELDRVLQYVLEKKLPKPEALKLRYTGQYIAAVSAIGAPDHVIGPAKAINQIRNSFAHMGQEDITDNDVRLLQVAVEHLIGKRPFPSEWSVEYRRKELPSQRWVYKDMSAKERFCTLSFIAISGLALLAEPEASGSA